MHEDYRGAKTAARHSAALVGVRGYAELPAAKVGSRDSKSCDVLVALVHSWKHADGLVQGPRLSP